MSATKYALPLVTARRVAAELQERLGLQTCAVAGSIRRERPLVHDIDFVGPVPARTGPDATYDVLARCLDLPNQGLFKPQEPLGVGVKGVHRFFYYCELRLFVEGGELPVQIHRYDPGNAGWIQVLRTGPKEFGEALLAHWRRVHQLPRAQKASDDGYLRYADGRPAETPTEERVFELADLQAVPPARRVGATSIVPLR